ncbi:hypothetical protein QL285_025581 [Trifolium repens]|nr:hypothetical protein QL285_025581 [Trifolium repens]
MTWRESYPKATRYMDGALAPNIIVRTKYLACTQYVEGDNHPSPPRSAPKLRGNRPLPPCGSGGGVKKPPGSWGIHDLGP